MNDSGGRPRPYRMGARARAAEETRRLILHAAATLFGELLYDQVALTDVAERAGVAVQTVLRRFGSKDELFAATAHERSPDARRSRDIAPVGNVAAAVECLAEDYERAGHYTLHLLAQERRSSAIAAAVHTGRRYHQDWVGRVFAPQLDRLGSSTRDLVHAQLVTVTDLYAWKVLREDAGLDRDRAQAAVTGLIERAVG